jgi:transposase
LILGLACTGLAVTAGTYATAGIGAPVRIGLSLAKAARATGRMSVRMGEWIGRSLRDVLDWGALARAIGGATFTGPVIAVRAAREAIKVEKTEELFRFAGDIGRVQGKAGTQAALDGLKIAEGPRDMSRIAKLAERYGGKTRAVLKLGGRAAIWLTIGTLHLLGFILAAIMNVFGFCAACKRAAERATERYCRRRGTRARRLRPVQGGALRTAIEAHGGTGEGALLAA